MKILVIFIDMFRTDILNIYDNSKSETIIDRYFKDFGGILYNNVWTPCPDTGRSLSAFWSGIPCYENGCNNRGKYPAFFLDKESFLDRIEKKGFNIRLISNHQFRADRIYPEKYTSNKYQLKGLDDLKDTPSNSFTFIDILDFHEVLDFFEYKEKTIKIAHNQVFDDLNSIFSKVEKNIFDKIVFFSDHGMILKSEKRTDSNFIGKARSRIFMQYWDKNTIGFKKNNTLLSITDIHKFIENDYEYIKNIQPIEHILIEDFKTLESTPDSRIPNIWMYKKAGRELVFNNLEIKNYFLSKNDLFLEAISNYPHLNNLSKEQVRYQNVKHVTKNMVSRYYVDGKKRKTSFKYKLKRLKVKLTLKG